MLAYVRKARAMKSNGIDRAAVGQRLDALRRTVDLNRITFAAHIGLDSSSYTKIVRGDIGLSSEVAFRTAQKFGVTMDFIYRGDLSGVPETYRAAVLKYLGGQTV